MARGIERAEDERRHAERIPAAGGVSDWSLIRELLTVSGPLAAIVWYLLTRVDTELHALSVAVVHLSDQVTLLAQTLR